MASYPEKTTIFGSIGTPLTCPVCLTVFVQVRVELGITAQLLRPGDRAHTAEVMLSAKDQVIFAEPCGHQVITPGGKSPYPKGATPFKSGALAPLPVVDTDTPHGGCGCEPGDPE